MFDLSFFYTDEEQTIQKELPNSYKFFDAINDVEEGLKTLEDAANTLYEAKMWQWFHIHRLWDNQGRSGEMFEQPTLESTFKDLYSHFRESFKASRTQAVANIKVTVDSMVFDGDEISRARMVTAIASSDSDIETVKWALADNTVVDITSVQLKEALKLSGKEMERIWFQ